MVNERPRKERTILAVGAHPDDAEFTSGGALAQLKRLEVTVESDVNFAPVFGLPEEPIIEGMRITLSVESEAPEEKIKEIEALAAQRCPGVFCMANAIPFETRLEYEMVGEKNGNSVS